MLEYMHHHLLTRELGQSKSLVRAYLLLHSLRKSDLFCQIACQDRGE
jgi:hypothetical protein